MRRKSLIIVLGCVLLAVGLILTLVLRRNSPADIDETKNLITNGGFEKDRKSVV